MPPEKKALMCSHIAESRKGWFGRMSLDEQESYRETMRELKIGTNVGSDNGQWQGGTSFEPYGPEFNLELKERIRNREGRHCFICGKPSKRLSVHHVDYDKMNNDDGNLVALCGSCHSKTNSRRESWQVAFDCGVFLST